MRRQVTYGSMILSVMLATVMLCFGHSLWWLVVPLPAVILFGLLVFALWQMDNAFKSFETTRIHRLLLWLFE